MNAGRSSASRFRVVLPIRDPAGRVTSLAVSGASAADVQSIREPPPAASPPAVHAGQSSPSRFRGATSQAIPMLTP